MVRKSAYTIPLRPPGFYGRVASADRFCGPGKRIKVLKARMKISFSTQKSGWALLGIGIVLSGVVFFNFYNDSIFLKKAIQGQGKIISVEKTQVHNRAYNDLLGIQFLSNSSRLIEVRVLKEDLGPHFSSAFPLLYVGMSVTFLYDPDNPQEIRSLQVSYEYPWSEILLLLASFIPVYFGLRILKKTIFDNT